MWKGPTNFSAGSCYAGALAEADVGGDGVQVGGGGGDAHGENYVVVWRVKSAVGGVVFRDVWPFALVELNSSGYMYVRVRDGIVALS
jgi:hypothetical protein